MKKIFMAVALIATMAFASCGNANKETKVEATEVATEVVNEVAETATEVVETATEAEASAE